MEINILKQAVAENQILVNNTIAEFNLQMQQNSD